MSMEVQMDHEVLSVLNPEKKVLPGPHLLHELISKSAGKAVAIEFLDANGSRINLKYEGFESLSQNLSRQIRRRLPQHVTKQHIVPVIIPQCPELYIAWRAVLEAGAGFCPISPDVPAERLNFILKDVSADVFVCLEEGTSRINEAAPGLACLSISLRALNTNECQSAKSDGADDVEPIRSDGAAYVQYTSGSSGLPKGVIVSHFAVTQSLLAHDEHLPHFERFLQFASPTFDVSIFEVFFAFFRGATLVSRAREQMLADLPGTIRALNADAAELTPTVASTLLRTRAAAPCLRTLLTIGEMLNKSVISEFGGSGDTESMLYAMYGPTEAAIHCTLAPKLSTQSTIRNIGIPLSTVTAFVVSDTISDSGPEIVARGKTGELVLAGQLADGYLNRPEQNDTAFVDLPGYGRVYRTGDRAVCNRDGQLEILGRMAMGQVKLRGQRVELGEIEEVASKTDGLTLAVASVIDDLLVLFCVSTSNTTSKQVREVCNAWLPPFMRPRDVVILGSDVPRLPSGKVDRKQLESTYRNPGDSNRSPQGDFANDDQRYIAAVIQEVLGCKITSSTSLWSAGMDSLQAIRIVSRLRPKLPRCTVVSILESETISDIFTSARDAQDNLSASSQTNAALEPENWSFVIDSVKKALDGQRLSALPRILPCSSMQISMLTETTIKPELYFNVITVKRSPGVTRNDLWRAMCQVAQSNELLRSGFCYTGEPSMPFAQVVWEELVQHDLDLLHPLQIGDEADRDGVSTIQIHHAIYDGWSWELILDDLNTVLAGKSPATRPSFQNFVSHQAKSQEIETRQGIEYWESLSLDFGRSTFPSLASSSQQAKRQSLSYEFKLSYSQLSELAEDIRVSRQTFFQACWARLMTLYTDSDEVLFGSVISGRHITLDAVDQIIGPCLSTLPTKIDFQTVNTIRDLLTFIQRQNMRGLQHSDVSVGRLLKRFQKPPKQPLFDTLFVWQQGEKRPRSMRQYLNTADTRDALEYKAVFEVEPVHDKLQGRLTVDTKHIPACHARLLLDQLDVLMSIITANFDKSIHELDEWEGIGLEALSMSNTDYEPFQKSFDLFTTISKVAREAPRRAAIRFVSDFSPQNGDIKVRTMSYGSLYHKASNAAAALVRLREVHPDNLVCIVANKSVELYVIILAVMMAGAGYMYIDPKTPEERAKGILQQANCVAVLTDHSVNGIGAYRNTIPFSMILENTETSEHFVPRASKREHLAYCVWTSGTAGKPKGVLVTRHNLLSNLHHLSNIYPCSSENGSLLQACSPAFDVSVFEIFWTWHRGMELCAASNDVLFRDAEKLIDILKITHLSMTPSVAALLDPDRVPSVEMLVTAGEPMNSRVFSSWAGRGLYQGYGPSETTNICNIRPEVQLDDVSNNVGPIFKNSSLFVCSRGKDSSGRDHLSLADFRVLPKGAVGEIWIGGDQVARGYVDQALTARSFLDHPIYGRLYRSGDIGRLLADDNLLVLGRDDDQTKVRGQRVELSEVNGVLIQASEVEDAVSLVYKNDRQDRLLSFCKVKATGQSTTQIIERLFSGLESKLPLYMLPEVILPVDALPLTKQGKVDRTHLIRQYHEVPPRTLQSFSRHGAVDQSDEELDEIEKKITTALASSLNIPDNQIRANSSFYTLGLDSINSIRFSQELRRIGFDGIDVSTILQHPSLALLKPLLSEEQGQHSKKWSTIGSASRFFDQQTVKKVESQIRTTKLAVESILPCTDLQLSMLSSSDNSITESYRNKMHFKVIGDIARLKNAWEFVQARHPLLRTTFIRIDSTEMPYAQVVLRAVSLPWHGVSSTALEHGLLPYHLRIEQPNNSFMTLILEIHHSLYDAEAMNVLLKEVQAVYHEQALPQLVPFSHYLDYMIDLNGTLTESFWSCLLTGVEPCRLSEILPRSPKRLRSSAQARLTSRVSVNELEAAVHGRSTTTLAILQASLARILSCYFKVQQVCFGTVYSGRNLPIDGIEHLVGPCLNTLPVLGKVKSTTSNINLAHQFQTINAELISRQPSSLRRIQRLNTPDGAPLFDILLLLQQNHLSIDTQIWELIEDSGEMSFPFILEASVQREVDRIEFTLHSEVSDEETLIQILRQYDKMLYHTFSYPEAQACGFSYIAKDVIHLNLRSRTPTISHAALREPLPSLEPFSAIEQEVRNVISRLASSDPTEITRETTVFQLGLDSINTVQIAAKMRDCGYHISSAAILEAPSVAEIAAACSVAATPLEVEEQPFDLDEFAQAHLTLICERLALDASLIDSVWPCTTTQSGILSEYLRSEGQLYFNTIDLELERSVDKGRLLRSWQAAMDRHEMLRTGFAENDSGKHPFVMITYKAGTLSLPVSNCNFYEDSKQSLAQPMWQLSFGSDEGRQVLSVSLLHALYDAQSLDRILADVVREYQGKELDSECSVGPALASILGRSVAAGAKNFWQQEQHLVQPTKFPDLNIQTPQRQTSTSVNLKGSLSLSDIQRRCARLGCSFQAVCQAVWAKILAAYTGQRRVTFALIFSGRDFGDGRDEAAFPFINTVPFTIDVSDDMHAMLDEISKMSAGLFKYQYTPFTTIKRWQATEGEVLDTILVLQKFRSKQPKNAPWQLLREEASTEHAVSLEVLPDDENDTVILQATYSERVLPPEAARILLEQVDDVLCEVLRENGINTTARPRQLSHLPAKDDLIPSDVQFLHEFVERTAAVQPDSPALEFVTSIAAGEAEKMTWSYAELDLQGNRVANLLVDCGVKTGELVAVCFDKCPEASFAILGVLKAGAAYVAIDPSAPLERKIFILRDAGCKVVLTTKEKSKELEDDANTQVFALDEGSVSDGYSPEPAALVGSLNPQDTCYCLYTSGTTGTPKGCLISHQSAVQAMMSFQRIFKGHWTASSRWLQFASFHFDVSVLEQYWSWGVGICVTSASRDLLLEDLPSFIEKTGITHLDLTPSLARLLSPENVPNLCQGVFIVGGEQLSQDIIDTWGDAGCLYNFYGPSEVTIGCTVHPRVKKGVKPVNIGQQWDNVGSFVLEPNSRTPVLRGAMGELCLSGVLVGQGYLNRSDLTGKKFVCIDEYAIRVYRTGDLVRMLHDNSFEFLGRIDDQVKLRGQRLEIGEINQVIRQCASDVKGVASAVIKHPTQGKDQIVAFFSMTSPKRQAKSPEVVSNGEATRLAARLRQHCVHKLPGYMVPVSFIMVSTMPLSANNKLDIKILERTYSDLFHSGADATHKDAHIPTHDVETFKKLSAVLSNYLSLPMSSIKASSRLFELGIDSVSAIGFAGKLKSQGLLRADVSIIMKHPLVADLTHALNFDAQTDSSFPGEILEAEGRIKHFSEQQKATILQALQVKAAEIEHVAPCTPLQEAMISRVQGDEGGNMTYFTQLHLDMSPSTDPQRMRYAWTTVQRLTSVLRTYFVSTAHGFAQVVLSESVAPQPFDHEGSLWNRSSFDKWSKAASKFGHVLPWQVRFSPSFTGTYMTLFIFHGLYDGISLPVLLNRVAMVYNDEKIGPSMFYEVLSHGPLLRRSDAEIFWKRHLTTVRGLKLKQRPRAKISSKAYATSAKRIVALSTIHQICADRNVTEPAIFHSAWLLVLQKFYGVNTTLGLVLSGRAVDFEDAEDIIGPMINTLPCTIELAPSQLNFDCLIQACHKFNVQLIPYQHTALRDIARWVCHNARANMFDCLFVYQKEKQNAYRHNLWKAGPAETVPDYPLNFEVEQKLDGTFALTLVVKADYVDFENARELLDRTEEILKSIDCGRQIALPEGFVSHEMHSQAEIEDSGRQSWQLTASEEGIWTPNSEKIREQIAELSGTPSHCISLDKPDIFELGLDSIDAMKLAARLQASGLNVPVSKILRAGTVAGISAAASVAQENSDKIESPSETIGTVKPIAASQDSYRALVAAQGVALEDVERILPATPMQEGLLLDFQKYCSVAAFELSESVDIQRLKIIWNRLVKDHPILRTRFAIVDMPNGSAGYLQLVKREEQGFIDEIIEAKELKEAIETFRQCPTDLGRVQALKIAIVGSSEIRYMVTAMSHATYDAWSLRLLHQAAERLYYGLSAPGSESTQGLKSNENYLDAVTEQSQSEEAKSFWQATLAELKPTIFEASKRGAATGQPLLLQCRSAMAMVEIQAFCRVQGITMQSLGLACWSLVLASYAGSLNICFGLVLSGRTLEGLDQLIFPTFNTVIFNATVKLSEDRRAFAKRIHGLAMDVTEYQHFPLREASKIARSTTLQSFELFNTLFTFQKIPEGADSHSKLYREVALEDQVPNPPYAVNVEMEAKGLDVWWTIATQEGFADANEGESLLQRLDDVLRGLVQLPREQVLERAGEEVSICSLPSITLPSDADTVGPILHEEISAAQDTWTLREMKIREVCANLAKIDVSKIGKGTVFYELGLDSISAIKLSSLLKKQGIRLPVSKIVKAQTIEKMAALADAAVQDDGQKSADRSKELQSKERVQNYSDKLRSHSLDVDDVEDVLPVTAGQSYMLDTWSQSRQRLFYPDFWLRVQGTDRSSVERAMHTLSEQVPILRTVFLKFQHEAMLQVALKSATARPATLPWSYKFYEKDGQLFLAWKLHHALYDAVSLQIMVSQLERFCTGDSIPPRVNTDISTFVAATTDLREEQKASQRSFWTTYLNGYNLGNIRRGSFSSLRSEIFEPEALRMALLNPLIRRGAVSIQAFFFAACARAYGQLLSGREGARHVVLGVYLANRSLDVPNLPLLAIPTFNIAPLKIDISLSLVEGAREVQRDLALVSKAEHCGVSLKEIHEWTGERVDCVVNFLRVPEWEGDLAEKEGGEQRLVKIAHLPVTELLDLEEEDLGATSPFWGGKGFEQDRLEWILPSIDIEAKIEGGYLGVGVFAPEEMVDGGGVGGMVKRIAGIMLEEEL